MMKRAVASWAYKTGLAVALFSLTAAIPAVADDYRFFVNYTAHLNGLPVGEGHLLGRFDGTGYKLSSEGRFTGLARLVASYDAKSEAHGDLFAGPSGFRAKARGGNEEYDVTFRIDRQRAHDVRIRPEPDPDDIAHPKRIVLTDEHKHGVTDPLSALITPGGFNGETFDRGACNRVLPVFSGSERFDMRLSYGGVRSVSSNRSRGYSGPVLVCSVHYEPVAGHRTNHRGVRYMQERANTEIMLAPVADSDILVPYRASFQTPVGRAVIQAGNITTDGNIDSGRLARGD